jgi:signal transduction histidine kinase/PAS domain-containing protein
MTASEIDILNEGLLKSIQSQPKSTYEQALDAYRFSTTILYEKGRIDATKILALCAHSLGLLEDSYNYLEECLPYYEETQDFATLAHLHNIESFIYQQLNEPHKRLEASEKSRLYAEKSGKNELLIRSLNNLGDAYLATNRISDAITTFNHVLEVLSTDNSFMRAVVHCNLAEAYLKNGDFSSAHDSIGITLSTIEANQIHSLREASLIILGRIFLAEANFDQLLSLVQQWESITNTLVESDNSTDEVRLSLDSQIELNELKIAAFEGMSDFEAAFKLKKLNDTLIERKNKDLSSHAMALFNLRNEINQLKTESANLTELVDKRTKDLNHALHELRRKEAKSQTILNHSSNAIFVLNNESEITESNEKGVIWFGKQLKGLRFLDLFYLGEDEKVGLTNKINRLLHIEDKLSNELQFELAFQRESRTCFFEATVSKLDLEETRQAVVFLHDITVHKELEQLRLQELKFESALAELNELLHIEDDTTRLFSLFLGKLVDHVQFSEAQLFWFNEEDRAIRGVASHANFILNLDTDGERELTSEQILLDWSAVRSQRNLRESMGQHILLEHNRLRGILEFNRIDAPEFSSFESKFIAKACDLLIIRINQLENELKKDELQRELMLMNQQLEQEVNTQMAELQKLQHEHSEHEKLVLLSEINANLAHEINTPLGVVKSANQAVFDQFSMLVNNQLTRQFSPIELDFIKTHSLSNPEELTGSGLRKQLERKAFFAYFEDRIVKNPEFKSVIEDIVECGFSLNQSDEIEFIMNSKSAREMLLTIKELKRVNSFHYMSNSNINRIGNILSEIHSITGSNHNQKTTVHILDQFENLRKFFKWDLRDKQFDIAVPADLKIEANEMNLSLLWFNLLRNAIEALDQLSEQSKQILVTSDENESEISLSIGNNGPQISSTHMDQIFTKFFSTKPNGKGRGLGLTICQKIAEDHNAKITCKSDLEKTVFVVSFKK